MDSDPEIEHENLALLKNASHPNIVEMLGSYTIESAEGKYQNLLFRNITGGDLQELLGGTHKHEFNHPQDFINALVGLASAVAKVHRLTPKNSRFIKNGFHHDLKPANILVDGKNFILSDFGLARFKPVDETTETAHTQVGNYYLAPECIDFLDTLNPCLVHRSSDMWSFGCIAAELVTFMIDGPEGIRHFKAGRKYRIGRHVRFDFHSGGEKRNEGVEKWFREIHQQAIQSNLDVNSTSLSDVVSLIRDILNHDAPARPKAPAVEARLCCIALDSMVRENTQSFKDILASEKYHNSVEAFIEAARFESIWMAIGLRDKTTAFKASRELTREPETQFIVANFGTFVRLLEQFKATLDVLRPFEEKPASPPFLEVKQLTTLMWTLVPSALQGIADALLRLSLLQKDDLSSLEGIENALNGEPLNDRILALVSMRKLDIMLRDNNSSPRLILDPKPQLDAPHNKNKDEKRTGQLIRPLEPVKRVLIESKSYRSWQDRESDVQERVATFVRTFSSTSLPDTLRTLRCIGYYHEPAETSLCIVYDFPSGIRQDVTPTTLWQIFADDRAARGGKERPKERPSLRSRFSLAHQLAGSVYDLHNLHWLHKSISSFNIVLFTSPASSVIEMNESVEQPYLMGFEHSRPDEEMAFSSKLSKERQEYQHPDFINGSRYRSQFDYYSLGVVLLEIAMWKSVGEITKTPSWDLPWEEFRQKLLRNVVPQLEFYVGPRYRNIVCDCLSMGLENAQGDVIPVILSQDFQTKVVARLGVLNV